MNDSILPLGKLPPELLADLLASVPDLDDSVLVGPGPGLDCAVLDRGGDSLLVLKSDPITFTAGDLGWYLVQVNANDIATTGATPRWLMATLLFPEAHATEALVRTTFDKLMEACVASHIVLIGGHTEVTQGIDRPIAVGTMIGTVPRDALVTPRGARPGDMLLLTKFVPLEAVAILCQEFPNRLRQVLGADGVEQGAAYHRHPGISVLHDAQIATAAGRVNAMHDPTEGGLASAIWELAEASGRRMVIDPAMIPVSELAGRVCLEFGINPLGAISSGALLLSVPEPDHGPVCQALREQGIPCAVIGRVESGPAGAWSKDVAGLQPLDRPERDEIARLFDSL
ncbi:MAG: AIR synthase family protein [Chloroflexota bacterium]|jgi:hydrogenase maturation factor